MDIAIYLAINDVVLYWKPEIGPHLPNSTWSAAQIASKLSII